MPKAQIKKLLNAVEAQELEAVGIYIEDSDYRVAEVEFAVDWVKHQQMINMYGIDFNTDIGGWDNGHSPEAYVAVQRLVKEAKRLGTSVRSWIRVSKNIRENPSRHKNLCDKLGYCFEGTVAPWKNKPITVSDTISQLEEANIIKRCAR